MEEVKEVNEKELWEVISGSRVEIKEIKYEGVVRTKKDVFEYYLESSRKQKRFDDVLFELNNAMFRLRRLNLFDSLTFTLSLPEKDPGKVPPSKLQPLQLLIKVKEKRANGGFTIGGNNKGEKIAVSSDYITIFFFICIPLFVTKSTLKEIF